MIVLNGEWEQEIKDAWESCDSFSDLYDENRCGIRVWWLLIPLERFK